MRLSTTFRGVGLLFEGDLPLVLRAIPAGAKVARASVTVAPAPRPDQFHEEFSVTDGHGAFGLVVQAAQDWAIVDLGVRRTVELVKATGFTLNQKVNVQLDLGGTWIQLDKNGNIAQPPATAPNLEKRKFDVLPPTLPLPNLTTARLRVVNLAPPTAIGVTGVQIVTYPSNLTLRLGSLGPFWFRIGDLREAVTTPDFAPVFQGFLDRSQPVDGVFELPFIVHSDTLARLELALDVEYHLEQGLLAPGLRRLVLPFAYAAVPTSQPASLAVSLPLNARVLPRVTSARVVGRFDASRVVHGPLDSKPVAESVRIAPQHSVAAPIRLTRTQGVDAIDLHVEAVTAQATLLVTLQEDVGGKPFGPALLPEPIQLALERPAAGGALWASAPLPAEFAFEKDRTYWLIVNAALGEVDWAIEDARGAAPLQATQDDGLSWRAVTSAQRPGGAAGIYRLRSRPAAFRQPIAVEVGGHRVSLGAFDALGKVDFALDLPEFAGAFNAALSDAARDQATLAERVANGDFTRWTRLDRAVRRLVSRPVALSSAAPAPTSTGGFAAPQALAVAPDASHVYVAAVSSQGSGVIDVIANEPQPRRVATLSLSLPQGSATASGVSLAVSPDGARLYAAALVLSDESRGLVVWRLATPSGQALPSFPSSDVSPLHRPLVAADPSGGGAYVALADSDGRPVLLWLPDEQSAGAARSRPDLILAEVPGEGGENVLPEALLVAPDGRRAYVALSANRGVAVVDLTRWKLLGRAWFATKTAFQDAAVPVPRLTGLALAGDGARLFAVADLPATSLSTQLPRVPREVYVIDAVALDRVAEGGLGLERAILARSPLGEGALRRWLPTAATPDDTNLLIGGAEAGRLVVIDTATAKRFDQIDLRAEAVDLAVTPEGRRAFVVSAGPGVAPNVRVVELDGWTPDHWAVTAGRVAPVPVAGSIKSTAWLGSPTESAGISQVFEVSGGRPYLLRFRARASDADAQAELFWLNRQCALLGNLSVEIERPLQGGLQPHAVRGIAPAAAERAELRFRQPAGGYTLLDDVSVTSPVEATENGEFTVRTTDPRTGEPVLAGWSLQPEGATLSSVVELLPDGGIRLSGPTTLSQSLVVTAGGPFELELRGYPVGEPPPAGHPAVELRWTGSQSDPVRYELIPQQFDVALLRGTVPPDAKGAELVLTAPPGSTVEISLLRVSHPAAVDVPVTFLSEAPGELTVEAPVVGYDVGDDPRPKVDPAPAPPVGCQPTPPEDEPAPPPEPGEEPLPDEPAVSYCPCCEAHHLLDAPEPILSDGGMAGLRGTCPTFGTTLAVFPARR